LTYCDPMKDEIFGCSLYYRVEHRANGDVVIVSFRRKDRILYEASPVGGKAVRERIKNLLPTLSNGKGFLVALPEKTLAKILNEWVGLDSPDSRERRKSTSELTLGILILADHDKLLYGSGAKRSDKTVKDDERAIDRLLEHFGDRLWREVTPEFCAPWLWKQSQRAKKDCRRIMMGFELLQLQAGVLDVLTWEHYSPKDIRRHKKTQKSAVQSQVEPVMLTDGQCASILQKIRERLTNGKVTGLDMAVLLTLGIATELPYISALDLTDFQYLKDYKSRLTVRVERKMEKAEKNYISHEIEDPYERRTIPLPTIAAEVYRAIIEKSDSLERPLCGDPNNSQRRLNPEKLKMSMADSLKEIKLIRMTDVPGIRLPTVVDILPTTGLNELEKAGLEKEELRVLRGKRPVLVSAKHYYDRTNEAALNKMGAIQDRWLQRLCPIKEGEGYNEIAIKAVGDTIIWTAKDSEMATQVWVEIDVGPVPSERIPGNGIWLELTSLHGLTGTIVINKERK